MANKFVTPTEVAEKIDAAVDSINKTMGAVVLVLIVALIALLVSVAAMVIDTFQSRTDATNNLNMSVEYLNQTIMERFPIQEILTNPTRQK